MTFRGEKDGEWCGKEQKSTFQFLSECIDPSEQNCILFL